MKIERTYVSGFENAIHGMRAQMNSWDKSDTHFGNQIISMDDIIYRDMLFGQNM